MSKNSKRALIVSGLIAIIIMAVFYFRYQVYFSHGSATGEKIFEIAKGEGNAEISTRLAEEGLVSNRIYFYYYLRTHGFLNRIIPGDYKLAGTMTIPEIANAIANPKETFIRVTFPEGVTAVEMGDILEKRGLEKDEFLSLVAQPDNFRDKYPFLNDPKIKTLEGFLFPDTYYFKKENTGEQIVNKILVNFGSHLTDQMESDAQKQGKSLYDEIVLASIVEKEVVTPSDMKMVAGVFLNRLDSGMPIQSDATLTYILNDNTDQHSIEQLKSDSPYNSYRFKGLPPGPISNPGLNAISAAIYPEISDYNYFLTVTVDGAKKTIFSKTFEEHVANRKKYGL